MCGIAGLIHTHSRAASEDTLRDMAQLIHHRGPDGEGVFTEGPLGLAHKRLSILDLREVAGQPMTSEDARYVLVFNGEIYNFADLRSDMEAKGERFTTSGDTEVVLRALMRRGPDALPDFNGMFALAFYDRHTRRLLLARDRYGIKPLYTFRMSGSWAFASEIKSFRALDGAHFEVDEDGLSEYLTFMNFLGERTLFKHTSLFPPGSWQSIDLDDLSTLDKQPTQFWDFRFTGNAVDYDADAIADELEASFTRAVMRQTISDVGVSSFLSGGVDSGSITAVASREIGPIRTFTAHFDFEGVSGRELSFDERDDARDMAEHFGTDHHEVEIGPESFSRVLHDLIAQLDEPRVGQSYPNYIVSGLAARTDKVVLSGCGGDELFAGYPWRYRTGMPAESFHAYLDGYFANWRRLARNDDELNAMLARPHGFDARGNFEAVFPAEAFTSSTPAEWINWALYFEAKTFMQGLLLVEDKVSMAHSLETRVPFLDNDFVDLAQTVPIQSKIAGFAADGTYTPPLPSDDGRTRDGKLILRHMMKRLVPEEVAQRKKQGFSAPDGSWWAGRLHGQIQDELLGRDRRLHALVSRDFIVDLLEGHRANTRTDGRHKIWSLLSLAGTLDAFDAA